MNAPLSRKDDLFSQLQQQYPLKRLELELAGRVIRLYKVSDIDLLLDRISDSEEIPFWAELWPASLGMAQYMLNNGDLFRSRTMLELGAGVGLAGIAAKLVGAETVQSDFMAPALEFCALNCLENQVSPAGLLQADWRCFPKDAGRFDWIIGSDILYEKTLHLHLEEVLQEHLKPSGTVVLADPGRDYARLFQELCVCKGWHIRRETVPVWWEDKAYPIDIYQLMKPGNL